jgi:hypothetical protein
MLNSKNSLDSPMFLLEATPAENVEHVKLMKWSFAELSFATDCFSVLVVCKSSSVTVATNQLRG